MNLGFSLIQPSRLSPAPSHSLCASAGRQNRPYSNSRKSRLVCESAEDEGFVSGTDLLGPGLGSMTSDETGEVSIESSISEIELKSDKGIDYTKFRDLLLAQDFQKADDEFRANLRKLAGESAETRGWIYFTEVQMIPDTDMKTMDDLWRASSNDKFGLSVQKTVCSIH